MGVTGGLLGRLVALLACWAGSAHERLDRAARRLTGGPDPVDQHAAEAGARDSSRDHAGRIAAAQRALADDPPTGVPHPRRALTVHHRPVGGVLGVPTLAHVEVLDDTAAGWALGQALHRYYADACIQTGPSDGDDLAAVLAHDGIHLARTVR